MTVYLGAPPEKHSEFKTLVDGLILSPVNYAIMEHPTVVADFIQSFWSSVTEHTNANGTLSIVGIVQGQPITITEQIIRENGTQGAYTPTEKKLLHPYWRYLAHVVTQCLSGRKRGYDVLNQTLSSCLVALALGMDFNYSGMIFRDMHANIKGKRKERFLAFPSFLQIIINKQHPTLVPTIGTLGVKKMREDIFGYMKMNKRGKKQFVGERPLIKFGRFVGDNTDESVPGTPVAIVAKEHNISAAGTSEQNSPTAKDVISASSSSSSEDFVPEKPPPTRAEREEAQDADYTPTPESSPN
ncbi:hypothetical protein R6Q57_020538 [Mikania cordata]